MRRLWYFDFLTFSIIKPTRGTVAKSIKKFIIISLFPLFGFYIFYLFFMETVGDYFVCFNEKKDRAEDISLEWDGIVIGHKSFPNYSVNFKEPLQADMRGGSYNITRTDEQVIVRYIQDTVLLRVELPSGEIVKDTQEVWNAFYARSYQHIVHYHLTTPVINEYVFNRKKPILTLHYLYSFPPRRTQGTFYRLDQQEKVISKKLAPLSPQRNEFIFRQLLTEKLAYHFPHCERENVFQGLLRHILKVLQFV